MSRAFTESVVEEAARSRAWAAPISWTAFQQLQTYKAEIPSLFAPNALLIASDGLEARAGTLTAGREWFRPWRTIAGDRVADPHLPELQVMIEGLLAPHRLLDLVRDFIVFEDDGSGRPAKKMAGYHSWPRYGACRGATSPWSCSRSC